MRLMNAQNLNHRGDISREGGDVSVLLQADLEVTMREFLRSDQVDFSENFGSPKRQAGVLADVEWFGELVDRLLNFLICQLAPPQSVVEGIDLSFRRKVSGRCALPQDPHRVCHRIGDELP